MPHSLDHRLLAPKLPSRASLADIHGQWGPRMRACRASNPPPFRSRLCNAASEGRAWICVSPTDVPACRGMRPNRRSMIYLTTTHPIPTTTVSDAVE